MSLSSQKMGYDLQCSFQVLLSQPGISYLQLVHRVYAYGWGHKPGLGQLWGIFIQKTNVCCPWHEMWFQRSTVGFKSLSVGSIDLSGRTYSTSTESLRKVSRSINNIKLSFEANIVTEPKLWMNGATKILNMPSNHTEPFRIEQTSWDHLVQPPCLSRVK